MEKLLFVIGVVVGAHGLWLVALVARRGAAAERQRSQQRRAQWQAARLRAERLLAEKLTDAELRQLTQDDYLEVRSPHIPNRVYRIPRHRDIVEVYEDGEAVLRLCIQPVERLPDADVVLAHKWMIESNEAEYLRIANHLPVTRWF